jgi:peptidoglycan/LPS O-acetylase OafA/YrhL
MVLVISSTSYDVFTWLKKQENSNQALKTFSLFTNGKTLFNLDVKAGNSIGSIHGIRGISILSIILVHTYFFRVASPFIDGNDFDKFHETKFSSVVSALAIAVDTFLVISGALITRSLLKDLKG